MFEIVTALQHLHYPMNIISTHNLISRQYWLNPISMWPHHAHDRVSRGIGT